MRFVIDSALLTAAMINATRPFRYPLSEADPALRLRRGVTRLMINGESRRLPGNYACKWLYFTKETNIHLLDMLGRSGQSGIPWVMAPWRKVVHPHVGTTEASLWVLALLWECWGGRLWVWWHSNRYWTAFHWHGYMPKKKKSISQR